MSSRAPSLNSTISPHTDDDALVRDERRTNRHTALGETQLGLEERGRDAERVRSRHRLA